MIIFCFPLGLEAYLVRYRVVDLTVIITRTATRAPVSILARTRPGVRSGASALPRLELWRMLTMPSLKRHHWPSWTPW